MRGGGDPPRALPLLPGLSVWPRRRAARPPAAPATPLPRPAAKTVYGTSLANVDWLHGSAESLLTLTNLFIVLGMRQGIRAAEAEKEQAAAAAAQQQQQPAVEAAAAEANEG